MANDVYELKPGPSAARDRPIIAVQHNFIWVGPTGGSPLGILSDLRQVTALRDSLTRILRKLRRKAVP